MNTPIAGFRFVASFLLFALSFSVSGTEWICHTVPADGDPMALLEKSVAWPKGHILLHHGHTWSSLPDVGLQVPGGAVADRWL